MVLFHSYSDYPFYQNIDIEFDTYCTFVQCPEFQNTGSFRLLAGSALPL